MFDLIFFQFLVISLSFRGEWTHSYLIPRHKMNGSRIPIFSFQSMIFDKDEVVLGQTSYRYRRTSWRLIKTKQAVRGATALSEKGRLRREDGTRWQWNQGVSAPTRAETARKCFSEREIWVADLLGGPRIGSRAASPRPAPPWAGSRCIGVKGVCAHQEYYYWGAWKNF